MVGGSGVAHEVVNGGGGGDGAGSLISADRRGVVRAGRSLSREAGSARARPWRGFERVSGTAHQALGEGGWAGFGVAVEVAVHRGWAGGHNTMCYRLSASTRKHELPLTLQPLHRRVSADPTPHSRTPDWESPVQPLCRKLGCCHGFFLVAPMPADAMAGPKAHGSHLHRHPVLHGASEHSFHHVGRG